jgi:hypothetical protein
MSIEIIDYQPNHLGLGEMDIHQLWPLLSEGTRCASGRDIALAPASQGVHEEKQIGSPLAALFRVVAGRLSRSGRQRLAHCADQWPRTLLATDLRAPRILGLGIPVQDLFPMPDKVRTYLGNAPLLALPGFALVFFRVRRTVSSEIPSPVVNATKRSAHSCLVQRARPAGGGLQASAPKKASCFPSHFGRTPARRRSLSAGSTPASTKRWRVRWRVESPTRTVAAISASLRPSAACRSLGARAIFRAEDLPWLRRPPRSSCSAAVKSTIYLSDRASSCSGRHPTASLFACQNLCGRPLVPCPRQSQALSLKPQPSWVGKLNSRTSRAG